MDNTHTARRAHQHRVLGGRATYQRHWRQAVLPEQPARSASPGKPSAVAVRDQLVLCINYLAETKLGVNVFDGFGLADVWMSYKVNGVWSEPQNLNDVPGEPPVNTAFHDHCLSFSADGNDAFWTSTRSGGFGGNDIWTSRRVEGKWTPPENLGPNVNGPEDEHHSIPTADGRSLYVTVMRDGGYGGDDTYITARDVKGKWGPLVNLGPLINGPGDERCPAWTPDGKIFLFDSAREDGFGSLDLWWVYSKDVQGYPLVAESGSARVSQPSAQFVNSERTRTAEEIMALEDIGHFSTTLEID